MFLPRVCRRALTKWFAEGDQRLARSRDIRTYRNRCATARPRRPSRWPNPFASGSYRDYATRIARRRGGPASACVPGTFVSAYANSVARTAGHAIGPGEGGFVIARNRSAFRCAVARRPPRLESERDLRLTMSPEYACCPATESRRCVPRRQRRGDRRVGACCSRPSASRARVNAHQRRPAAHGTR
jgi:hypothetical protein